MRMIGADIVARLLLLSLVFSCAAMATAPPPIAAFARLAQVDQVRVSPTGDYLVFISQSQGRRVAMTLNLKIAGSTPHPVITTDKEGNFDLRWCRWAKDTRLLCSLIAPIEEGRSVIRMTKLVAVNADGSGMKVLLQNSPLLAGSAIQDSVVDFLSDTPDTVLIEAPDSDAMGHMQFGGPAVWELNIYSGQLKKREAPHASILSYYSDGKGHLRLGVGRADVTSTVYFARRSGETEWRQLAKVKPFSPVEALIPIAVIPETNHAYASGPNGDRRGLWLIDLEDM